MNSTCDNPDCYCGITDHSRRTFDIAITIPDTNRIDSVEFARLLESQRDILRKVNTAQLPNYEDVELNTQVKDLKNMLEMVLMKLQFLDYEHEKTLCINADSGGDGNSIRTRIDDDDRENECELVILDNEVAQLCNSTSSISGEDELEAAINQADNEQHEDANDLQIDAEEVQLGSSNDGDDENDFDDTVVQDVDLELESVDIGENVESSEQPGAACSCDGAGCAKCGMQFCCDGSGCEICMANAVRKGIADDVYSSDNINSVKDLMSMLLMMSMATDSESIIQLKTEYHEPDLD